MKNVGIIGIGDMGMGMANNFLKAGYTVRGFDINSERLKTFSEKGGIACTDCANVGEEADVVFLMILNAHQANTVLFGDKGLAETLKPNSTVIITATIGLKPVKEIAAKLKEKNINLIDSGVSGGQSGAANGTLTMMAAGDKEVYIDCQDVMQVVGENIYHVGDEAGMGQVVKSCLQALVGANFTATFEMLVLGAKAGVKPEVLYEVVGSSVVGTPLFKNATEKIMNREFVGTGSHIGTMHKDLSITMDLAKEVGVPMFTSSVAYELFQSGITKFPEEDNWSIVKILEYIADVEVKKTDKK